MSSTRYIGHDVTCETIRVNGIGYFDNGIVINSGSVDLGTVNFGDDTNRVEKIYTDEIYVNEIKNVDDEDISVTSDLVTKNVIPVEDGTYDVGSDSKRYANVHSDTTHVNTLMPNGTLPTVGTPAEPFSAICGDTFHIATGMDITKENDALQIESNDDILLSNSVNHIICKTGAGSYLR